MHADACTTKIEDIKMARKLLEIHLTEAKDLCEYFSYSGGM